MKTLIVYHSEHHMNTEKVARDMSQVLGANLVTAKIAQGENISDYDLIGFGSGIYHGQFHKDLCAFVENLMVPKGTRAFLFSTTGSKSYAQRAHREFQKMLEKKGFTVVGEFICLGFDTALSSEGINKGHPNEQDLEKARSFASGMRAG
jgi:flavodoxin